MALWGQVPGALGAVSGADSGPGTVPGSLGAGPAALHALGPMPGVWGVLGRFSKCSPGGPQMHTYVGGRLQSEAFPRKGGQSWVGPPPGHSQRHMYGVWWLGATGALGKKGPKGTPPLPPFGAAFFVGGPPGQGSYRGPKVG